MITGWLLPHLRNLVGLGVAGLFLSVAIHRLVSKEGR